jgi:uncharacterized protein (DUF362 family)
MKSEIFVSKILKTDVNGAMERLLEHLPFPREARTIGIKLNLCDYRKPESGAVTDPVVLEPLLLGVRQRYPDADIFVYEHDATGTLASNLFGYVGVDRVASRYGVRCVSLANKEWVVKRIRGTHFSELEIPRILAECDLLINHPKLKTHGQVFMTCGLKNMYGCHRLKRKVIYHRRLINEAIVDINLAIPSHLIVVDANLCVEGNRGPTQGLPKRVGLLIGGSDIVAVDAFGAKLMGFKHRKVRHIVLAARMGLGFLNYQVIGDWDPKNAAIYKFRFSMFNYRLMQFARRLLK